MTSATSGLHAALRAHADGHYASRAAAELLIAHASWLHRTDFLDEYVHTVPGLISGIPMAAINWPDAITALNNGHLPCSGGEARILKIVASLAEGIPVDLRDALTGIDATNLDRVICAAQHAGGRK